MRDVLTKRDQSRKKYTENNFIARINYNRRWNQNQIKIYYALYIVLFK